LPIGAERTKAVANLDGIDWLAIHEHYGLRATVHESLIGLHDDGDISAFVNLALGINDSNGNYSASEHKLGPAIMANNKPFAAKRVFDLATKFRGLKTAESVPGLIEKAGLNSLKIGVGSEISCMINPKICWVANTRTFWADIAFKQGGDVADEQLQLYGDEIDYKLWSKLHKGLGEGLLKIADEGEKLSVLENVHPGPLKYIFADAIASQLYANYYGYP
jgi:hypothetical protein